MKRIIFALLLVGCGSKEGVPSRVEPGQYRVEITYTKDEMFGMVGHTDRQGWTIEKDGMHVAGSYYEMWADGEYYFESEKALIETVIWFPLNLRERSTPA